MNGSLVLGVVEYDTKVRRIWDGFQAWFRAHDLDLDYELFGDYERQVDALLAGRIDMAWNSPLAWIRTVRAAGAVGGRARALAMRDTDRGLRSVVAVRADDPVSCTTDLCRRRVATGAMDSPQATLIPLEFLAEAGVEVEVCRFDVSVGLHGDHIGGERDAVRALMAREVDAALVLDANHLMFTTDGTLAPGSTRILDVTPPYDHCNFTALDSAPGEPTARFTRLLLDMSFADPQLRPLFDLEGLTAWRRARTSGYALLDAAVDRFGFYDTAGKVTMPGYTP